MTVLRRATALVGFTGFYLAEVVRANVDVARHVLARRPRMRPALVTVPVRCTSDVEVATLSALLALTPGTLPVEIDRAAGTLTIHVLDSPSAERTRRDVAELERRLLEVLR